MKPDQRFFNEQLRKNMSVNRLGLREADPLLVFEARMAVMARKKEKRKTKLKKYQLMFSAMAFVIVSTFMITSTDQSKNHQLSGYHSETFTGQTYSLSVMSSTMLTSIPTLRN